MKNHENEKTTTGVNGIINSWVLSEESLLSNNNNNYYLNF